MPIPPEHARGGVITGWGAALPEQVITNSELPAHWGTSDEWITERTGIRQRHIGGTTSSLAAQAATRALDRAGLSPDQIDGVILATTTPDQIVPATSATVQDALGINAGAFDVNAACAGFVYGLVVAHGMLALGAQRLLLIGSETLSKISDWDDRTVTVLVGDGAGAIVLEAADGPGQLKSWVLGADGSLRHLLQCDHGGHLSMDGKEVFRKAVRVVVDSANQALEEAGLDPSEVDLMVPHQANLRIIHAACERLGIPVERAVVTIDRYANSSSASIPLALAFALDAGRLEPGHNVLLTGFGGGMTWASAVLTWGDRG
jgi:3-oxoacyl-[acyl-carrier-protein] synthase-3